mgnify:CR=1 FL=1
MNRGEFVTLTLGDEPWTFRALDFDQLEELEPEFAAVNSAVAARSLMSKETRDALAVIAAASLKHRHPDITPERCRKLITLGTWPDVISAVAGVSGLEPTGASGEAPAGS